MDERAHNLIDACYAAALDSAGWQHVAELLSERFDGAPVMIGFLPASTGTIQYYTVGLDEERLDSYMEHLLADGQWSTRFVDLFTDRFGQMNEVVSGVELDETRLYRDWMKPQGLAAVWPAGHSIVDDRDALLGGVTVFRAEGQPDFERAEFEAMTPFVGHMKRAVQMSRSIQGAQQVRGALAEAMDLLPTGLILLDERRSIVLKNRGADRILKLSDGIRADGSGPSLDEARQNAEFQLLIADAIESSRGGQAVSTGFLAIKRPSGKQAFATMVAPLLGSTTPLMGGAVAALFIADPVAGRVQDAEVLASLYSLTHAEAELLGLLSGGRSLEEAATQRGVSMNTARSHLKHIFAKTGTSRQGELIRLVVAGAGAIGEE